MGSAPPDPSPRVPQAGECSDTFSTFDVPIFTEEFLDQNKGEGLGCGAGAAGAAASCLGDGCSKQCRCQSSLHPTGQDHGWRWVRDPGCERSPVSLDRGTGSWLEPGGW